MDLRAAQLEARAAVARARRDLTAAQLVLERAEIAAWAGRGTSREVLAARLRVEELGVDVLLGDMELEVLAGELGR